MVQPLPPQEPVAADGQRVKWGDGVHGPLLRFSGLTQGPGPQSGRGRDARLAPHAGANDSAIRQTFSDVRFCCAAVDRVLANRAISTGLGGRSDTLGIAQSPCYSRA